MKTEYTPKKFLRPEILTLVQSYELEYRSTAADGSFYFDCPFCKGKGKLNVNTDNQLWRCNKCGKGGDAIEFVKIYNNVKFRKALEIIKKSPYNLNVAENHVVYAEDVGAKKPKKTASPERLDLVYRKLLSRLELRPIDKRDLKRRGLTDAEIEKIGFKSLPEKSEVRGIVKSILKEGITPHNIPGFYKNTYGWTMNSYPQGYLIPFVNFKNQITGFQVRVRNPDKDKNIGKYMMWTSSGKTAGTPSNLKPHIVGYKGQSAIYLTEGALKADIAHYFTYLDNGKDFAFMALPGVNHTAMFKEIIPELKRRGITKIYDCFDMDKVGNDEVECNTYVRQAVAKLREIAIENGFWWESLTWNTGKGIDDHLFSRKRIWKKSKL